MNYKVAYHSLNFRKNKFLVKFLAKKLRLCIIRTLVQLNSTLIFKMLFKLLHPRWSWLTLCTSPGSWVLQKHLSAISIVVSRFS